MDIHELLAAEAAELNAVFADHDPQEFTRWLALRVQLGDGLTPEYIEQIVAGLEEDRHGPNAGDPVEFDRVLGQLREVRDGLRAGRGIELTVLDPDVLEFLVLLRHSSAGSMDE
jgi:hypothetical protein